MFKKIYEKFVDWHNKIGLMLSVAFRDEPDDEQDNNKDCLDSQNQADSNDSDCKPQQSSGCDYVVIDGVRYYREAKPETTEDESV